MKIEWYLSEEEMTKRLIVKPTKESLIGYKRCTVNMPFQWINWWLYEKGEDLLLKSYDDLEHPLYLAILLNQSRICENMLQMLGGCDSAQSKIDKLLEKTKE